MRKMVLGLSLVFMGCSGGKDDEGSTDVASGTTCEQAERTTVGTTDQTEWPEGTSVALPVYTNLEGRWLAESSCGEPVAVKFTPKSQESVELLPVGWDGASQCGCIVDPNHDSDNQLAAVGTVDDFGIFLETFGEPGLDGQQIDGAAGLFGPGEAFAVRACGTKDIDPVLGSIYSQFSIIVRADSAGGLTGTLQISADGEIVETCDLTAFTRDD